MGAYAAAWGTMSAGTERRSNPRRQFSCRALLHDPYGWETAPDRFSLTKDLSRDGVYFMTEDRDLYHNKLLVMRFPETAPDREFLVEVKRITELPDDQYGVGARLILRAMLGRCREILQPEKNLWVCQPIVTSGNRVNIYI